MFGMNRLRWKKKLANLLIAMASRLDNVHLEKCTITLEGPKVAVKKYIPEDGKWHDVKLTLSYWMFVGEKTKEKEEVYIDGVHLRDQPVSPNHQIKVIADVIPDAPCEPLKNEGMEPWANSVLT